MLILHLSYAGCLTQSTMGSLLLWNNSNAIHIHHRDTYIWQVPIDVNPRDIDIPWFGYRAGRRIEAAETIGSVTIFRGSRGFMDDGTAH